MERILARATLSLSIMRRISYKLYTTVNYNPLPNWKISYYSIFANNGCSALIRLVTFVTCNGRMLRIDRFALGRYISILCIESHLTVASKG